MHALLHPFSRRWLTLAGDPQRGAHQGDGSHDGSSGRGLRVSIGIAALEAGQGRADLSTVPDRAMDDGENGKRNSAVILSSARAI